jgi:hypothetical protein
LAAVRSRSDNSAALVRDKVKRSRRTASLILQYLFVTFPSGTDDDGLLLLALEEFVQFHQSSGDVHLAEQSLWAIVWLRTRAASLPVDPAHFSSLVSVLLCREKFAPLARLLQRLLQRIEIRHGESSPEFFAMLQQILEVQFWSGNLKEADATATHLGRMRDKCAFYILLISTVFLFLISCVQVPSRPRAFPRQGRRIWHGYDPPEAMGPCHRQHAQGGLRSVAPAL